MSCDLRLKIKGDTQKANLQSSSSIHHNGINILTFRLFHSILGYLWRFGFRSFWVNWYTHLSIKRKKMKAVTKVNATWWFNFWNPMVHPLFLIFYSCYMQLFKAKSYKAYLFTQYSKLINGSRPVNICSDQHTTLPLKPNSGISIYRLSSIKYWQIIENKRLRNAPVSSNRMQALHKQ